MLTDTAYAEEVFGSRANLIDFVNQSNNDEAMDDTEIHWRMTDEEAEGVFRDITECTSSDEFVKLDKTVRTQYVQELYLAGLSMNQIAQYTDMAKSSISRTVGKIAPEEREERDALQLHEDACEFGACDEVW